jgi:hypothetical protein
MAINHVYREINKSSNALKPSLAAQIFGAAMMVYLARGRLATLVELNIGKEAPIEAMILTFHNCRQDSFRILALHFYTKKDLNHQP